MPDLTVLMPNPFYNPSTPSTYTGMHFFPEESHVDEIKNKYISDSTNRFTRWTLSDRSEPPLVDLVYKMRTNPFPVERYLAFTLEATLLGPGECHVFSPKITSPSVSASGVNLQEYQKNNPIQNVLSSSLPQGVDHFYYDHASSVRYEVRSESGTWLRLSPSQVDEIDISRIFDYQPETSISTSGRVEGFPFILKSGTSDTIINLYTGEANPTLQLIHFGAGGVNSTSSFGYIGRYWGSANQQDNSFGFLEEFSDAPLKDAPDTHQVGAKLLWLDETATEGNAPPLRNRRWTPDHMALNVAPVANWNVRAQLAIRSPASQVADKYYMTSAGAWFLQFVPHSPQSFNDQPSFSLGGSFVKNPFGASVDYSFSPNVILFDLPSSEHGVLSMARLRHAMLSPYSWAPSYIVGHSLRDLHAPSDKTAHNVAVNPYSGGTFPTRWDFLLGAAHGASSHGARARAADSQGLLQIGNQAVIKSAAGNNFSSGNEVLAYDIAFEVNQNLWDEFFLSSMPLTKDTGSTDWDASVPLLNPRYQFNFDGAVAKNEVSGIISGSNALEGGFYRSAEFLKNSAAFNVNSTSVSAWVAFLSSTLGNKRPLIEGEMGENEISFARHLLPATTADTEKAEPGSWGAWIGARKLASDEVHKLAESIVAEVKKRGPFLSLSDFINRRLADENDETSHKGAIDAAIMACELNSNFHRDPQYLTTSVNEGDRPTDNAPDNNHPSFRNGYRYLGSDGEFTTTQPASKAWGLPGFLIQSDVLESLAPALTTRGDTFVIRTYGESRDASGIKARAWIEAVVSRTPNYVDHRDADDAGTNGNAPLDAALEMDQITGGLLEGNLNEINQRFGRKFTIKSFRWLHPDEV